MNIIFWPIGSYECHGADLPPNTDSIIAERLAIAVQQEFTGSRMLPTLPIGCSSEHAGLPNTASCDPLVLFQFVSQVLDTALSENDIAVLVNGHGGNSHILAAAASHFSLSNVNRKAVVPSIYPHEVRSLAEERLGEFDVHAGSVESSLIAYYLGQPHEKHAFSETTSMTMPLSLLRTIDVNRKAIIKRRPDVLAYPEVGAELHSLMLTQLVSTIRNTLSELEEARNGRP